MPIPGKIISAAGYGGYNYGNAPAYNPGAPSRTFRCRICGETFTNKQKMYAHIKKCKQQHSQSRKNVSKASPSGYKVQEKKSEYKGYQDRQRGNKKYQKKPQKFQKKYNKNQKGRGKGRNRNMNVSAAEFVPQFSEYDEEALTPRVSNRMQTKTEPTSTEILPPPPMEPEEAFDAEVYSMEIVHYLYHEREPVPLMQLQTVHPLPKNAEEVTLKAFLQERDQFQLISIGGNICVTNTPEHIKKTLKNMDGGLKRPDEYWQTCSKPTAKWEANCPLFDEQAKGREYYYLPEWAEMGVLQPSSKAEGDKFFVNVHEPFCGIAIGVQGAGKSHSTNVIIENCMIQHEKNKLEKPITTVVFHYDQSAERQCENATLSVPAIAEDKKCVQKINILCSPSNYESRKKAYEHLPNCNVVPLLFNFKKLSASHLKKMMGCGAKDNQLYMQRLMTDLRKWKKNGSPMRNYGEFQNSLMNDRTLSDSQANPLRQRLELLESFLLSSAENVALRPLKPRHPSHYFEPGVLTIVDLVDPFIDQSAANSIFQVVLSMFIETELPCGKLVVFDEAHKYMDAEAGNLCHDIVRLVRQMRHYGIRTLVSTQNPSVLHSELLELCSFAILHRFHSPDWFAFLRRKLQLPQQVGETISMLTTGEAIVYSSRAQFKKPSPSAVLGAHLYRVLIKERVTKDVGATQTN